ncbi:MAG: hypothetical protein ACT4OZ_01110 [Gemmatimonadota bacterium]
MISTIALVLGLQTATVQVGGTQKADSIRQARRDSVRVAMIERQREREDRPAIRATVTPELERSAFIDTAARSILLRARDARFEVDSTLQSYDATAYQRLSAGIGFRALGRDRLLFRTENATRVRWSRANGVLIDVKGVRSAVPMARGDARVEVNDGEIADMSPIPWYPGREALWVGSGTARAEVDEREMIHPIALGAEAYYRYEAGDSVTITLSDGKLIRLRELRIIPRRPEWKLSVGSFWFDQANGQLVRAVYRFAAPLNIWAVAEEEIEREAAEDRAAGRPVDEDRPPGWVKGMFSPMEAMLEAVTIEYGLYGGGYWLPRTQYAEGHAKAGFLRVPFRMEESFRYASVNGPDSVPPAPPGRLSLRELRDSLFGKDAPPLRELPEAERVARQKQLNEALTASREVRRVKREEDCRTTGFHTQVEDRYDRSVRAQVRIPCDSTVLSKSPDLPPSIYDEGEELFGVTEREQLLRELDFGLQPSWAPMPILVEYGLSFTRYNRVEGFSTAARATQQLGAGYTWDASARLGTGDLAPGFELGVSRTDGRTNWRLGGYRRLSVANSDWGTPLSFGASLGALLFGRDEGFYYRSAGFELERTRARGGGLQTRLFLERQTGAVAETMFNLARSFGAETTFMANIASERVTVAGLALRNQLTWGQDPLGFRLFGEMRAEGGALLDKPVGRENNGWFRVAGDVNVTRGFGPSFASSVTASVGYSDGAPLQRHFFIGGTHTVRGQLPGAMSGEAYWLGRAEFSRATGVIRPVVFGDVGWAGMPGDWRNPGRPLSGAGIGASIMDGLIRLDLARGVYPRKGTRFEMYLEGRF